MKNKQLITILLLCIFFASCQPSPDLIQSYVSGTQEAIPTQTSFPTYTPFPTYTSLPTYEPLPTYTKEPTYTAVVIIVTATSSPTPLYTATITPIPTDTPLPTETPDPLKAPRGNGFYLVGVDIAPGVWRSDGTQDDCYWSVTQADGDIIDNHFGMAGGTCYISPNAFQVQFEDCGTWTFIQGP